MQIRAKHLLVGLFSLYCLAASATVQQLPTYTVSFPQPTTGCTVRQIEQDHNGFIWVATPNGIECFDGLTFRPYHLSESRERGINDGFMVKMRAAHGTLWTSTERGVVTKYDAEHDGFRRQFGTFNDQVWASGNFFYPTPEGFIIGTTSGLLPYYLATDSLGNFMHTQLNVKTIIAHPDGQHLLLGTTTGVKLYHPQTNQLQPLGTLEAEVNVLYFDEQYQCLWIGTQGAGLYGVSLSNPASLQQVAGTANMIVNVITPLNPGTLLIGTDGHGLLAGFTQSGLTPGSIPQCQLQLMASEAPNAPCHLPNSVVDDIVVDGDNLWLALSLGGMALMRPVHQHNLLSNPEAQSYADGFAFGVDVCRDGHYWVAFSRCLAHYEALGSTPEILNFSEMGNNLCLETATDGTVWIGGYNSGLHHYIPATRQLKHYPSVSGQPVNDCVYAILEDSRHDLWVGGMNFPLTCMHFNAQGGYDTQSYPIMQVSDLAQLNADTLVVTTFDSFYLLNIATGQMQRLLTGYDGIIEWTSTNALASVAVRRGREIWFATQGAGIVCYDAHSGQIQKYGADCNLPSLELCGIEFINDSLLCVSTDHNGLFTFNANTHRLERSIPHEAVGKGKGVFMRGASGADTLGHLIFGTDNGAIVLTSDYINAPQDTFQIVASGDFLRNGAIQLPSDSHSLYLQFTTTDVYHQHNYSFEYRILGFVDEWQPVGDTRTLRFHSLKPGDYVLQVRSNSSSSYIPELSIPLKVNPVIWMRWYFLFLYAVILVSFLYFVLHHYEVKRLSEIDGLTGIFNRRSGQRRISDLIRFHRPGVFVLIDCDRFKQVNDTYGHNVGDVLLKAIANAMHSTYPDQIALRIGGDEFALYLQGHYTPQTLGPQLKLLFNAIQAIHISQMPDYHPSVSMGVAFYDGKTYCRFDNLYTQADNRLYESKKYRNNHVTME